jgi:hypothetical protein
MEIRIASSGREWHPAGTQTNSDDITVMSKAFDPANINTNSDRAAKGDRSAIVGTRVILPK